MTVTIFKSLYFFIWFFPHFSYFLSACVSVFFFRCSFDSFFPCSFFLNSFFVYSSFLPLFVLSYLSCFYLFCFVCFCFSFVCLFVYLCSFFITFSFLLFRLIDRMSQQSSCFFDRFVCFRHYMSAYNCRYV